LARCIRSGPAGQPGAVAGALARQGHAAGAFCQSGSAGHTHRVAALAAAKAPAEPAPTPWTVPTGSRIRIDYSETPPVLAVRLQEMFGSAQTPRIANGRMALKLHLLSPAQRPVQVTQDLEGFWRSSYAEVKKDMKGRYPKHYWPDDPLQAEP